MKTLQEIKNNYAQEHGYEDWEQLAIINELHSDRLDQHWTEICIRAQKEALKKKIERMKSLRGVYDSGSGQHNILSILIYEFETNPENLIR